MIFSNLFCTRYVAYRVKKFNLTSGLLSGGVVFQDLTESTAED